MYSRGYGQSLICNELTRLGYKDSQGNVKWSCIKISKMLRNATYMGYIGYNKSKTTNYIDKVRVKNLDEDSIQLVKGNFPPVILVRCIYGHKNFVAAAAAGLTVSSGAF